MRNVRLSQFSMYRDFFKLEEHKVTVTKVWQNMKEKLETWVENDENETCYFWQAPDKHFSGICNNVLKLAPYKEQRTNRNHKHF